MATWYVASRRYASYVRVGDIERVKPRNDKGPVAEYRVRGGFRNMHAVCWQNFLDEGGKA